jgi:hypothetical protein
MCNDQRILTYARQFGGTYSQARKGAALELELRKARIRSVNSADPRTRELAKVVMC